MWNTSNYLRLAILFSILLLIFMLKSHHVQNFVSKNMYDENEIISSLPQDMDSNNDNVNQYKNTDISNNDNARISEDKALTENANRKCPFQAPSIKNTNGGYFYSEKEILKRHRLFDPGFGTVLIDLLENQSVVDIGAGVGQFGYFLKKHNANVDWTGFDGGNNIEEFWGKNYALGGDKDYVIPEVCWIDASQPIKLERTFDWTISVEVGEHIHKKYESIFIDNLISLSRKGVILTWAVKGQGGHRHINCQNNDYIISEMAKRGMIYDAEISQTLRDAVVKLGYLRNTAMVFRKTSL